MRRAQVRIAGAVAGASGADRGVDRAYQPKRRAARHQHAVQPVAHTDGRMIGLAPIIIAGKYLAVVDPSYIPKVQLFKPCGVRDSPRRGQSTSSYALLVAAVASSLNGDRRTMPLRFGHGDRGGASRRFRRPDARARRLHNASAGRTSGAGGQRINGGGGIGQSEAGRAGSRVLEPLRFASGIARAAHTAGQSDWARE